MEELKINHPELLWLLWLLPFCLGFLLYALAKRREAVRVFFGGANHAAAAMWRAHRLRLGLVLLATALLMLSLAGVQYGYRWREISRRGVDIVVALDLSKSMLVEDGSGVGSLSRLERARRELTDFLGMLDGDRIALVAFAGNAFLECPLTLDYGAAALFLEGLSPDDMPTQGTNIAAAIDTALEAFEAADSPDDTNSRAILLVTDGEDHSGQALEAAARAKEAGVAIYAIGIGQDEGAPVPAPGGGFARDAGGELILSRLDELTLQRIALSTGGKYARSMVGDMDLEEIYHKGIKARLVDRDLGEHRQQDWQDRFQWLLVLAMMALAWEPFVARKVSRATVSAVLLSILLSSPILHAKSYRTPYEAYEAGDLQQALEGFLDWQVQAPDDPRIALNIGHVLYRMGEFEAAEKAFAAAQAMVDKQSTPSQSAEHSGALRSEAAYNRGNALFRQQDLQKAAEQYQAALEQNPGDEDAQHNLQLVQRLLEEMPPQPQESDGDSNDDSESQEGEQQQQASASNNPHDAPQTEQDASEPLSDDGTEGDDASESQAAPAEEQTQGEEESAENHESADAGQDEPPQDSKQAAQPEPSEGLSKKEAERLLNAFPDDRVQGHRKKGRGGPPPGGKPW